MKPAEGVPVYVRTGSHTSGGCGCHIGLGGLIAGIISWTTHHSILWTAVHAVLGWLYVVYWIFAYGVQ